VHLSTVDAVVEQLSRMPQHLQWQVLQFAQKLVNAQSHGTPGQHLLTFADGISPEDLQLIHEAIEQDCEQIDVSEW
jgi:hypothetical protein